MIKTFKLALVGLQALACIALVLANSVSVDEHAVESSSEPTPTDSVAHDAQSTVVASDHEASKSSELVLFTRDDLTKLSRMQHELKNAPLGERCELFGEFLRGVFKDEPYESPVGYHHLFKQAIESLARRTNPYHGREQPYVGPLRECLDQLGDKGFDSLGTPASPKRRVVVNGPDTSSNVAVLAEKTPMDKVMDEFAEVKTRVVDPIKDLYPPKEAIEVASEAAHQKSSTKSESHDSGSDSGSGESLSNHADSSQLPHRAMDAELMRDIVSEAIREEELDELIDNERDPVKKLQLKLEREQRRTSSLLEQMDENRYEIETLLEEKREREAKAGGLDGGRFEMMRSMFEQASERERRTSAKLAEVQRQLADALSEHDHEEEDDDDSDSDYEDDGEKKLKNLAKMARKLQVKMTGREPLANRCQKYYMLREYPKKLNSKLVKMLANLALPPATPKAELFPALARLESELSRTSKQNNELLRELNSCQSLNARAPVYPPPSTSATFAAATATDASAVAGTGYWPGDGRRSDDFGRFPQKFGNHHHEINLKNGPNEFYHHEVYAASPDSPLQVLKTKTKSKTSYSSGTKPVPSFDVPVMGRDPTTGYLRANW